jgi:hypothetical protein
MRYQKEIKFMHKHKMVDHTRRRHEDISDRVMRKIISRYLRSSIYISSLLELKNIVPLYLVCGFIYLRRYLKNVRNKIKDSVLTKIFLTCCWIGVKNFNDTHVTCHEFLDNYKCDNREIAYIEAHILSSLNYDINISYREFIKWDKI